MNRRGRTILRQLRPIRFRIGLATADGGEGCMHIYKHILTTFARDNRRSRNLAEALLWNELKQSKLGYRFTK